MNQVKLTCDRCEREAIMEFKDIVVPLGLDPTIVAVPAYYCISCDPPLQMDVQWVKGGQDAPKKSLF